MSRYADRIAELHGRAERERETFSPPAEPPAEAEALRYLREGFGPAVAVYLDARTGGPPVRFGSEEFDRLEATMNTWLSLYARCHGVDVETDYSVRTAAEVLIDTHDVSETARVLTHVPGRGAGETSGREPPTPTDG